MCVCGFHLAAYRHTLLFSAVLSPAGGAGPFHDCRKVRGRSLVKGVSTCARSLNVEIVDQWSRDSRQEAPEANICGPEGATVAWTTGVCPAAAPPRRHDQLIKGCSTKGRELWKCLKWEMAWRSGVMVLTGTLFSHVTHTR